MFTKIAQSVLILALIPAASVSTADIKIKIIEDIPGKELGLESPPPLEITVYVHDRVQRVDYAGYPANFTGPREEPTPHWALITHCDTHVVYELDLNSREYRQYWLQKFPSEEEVAKAMAQDRKENQPVRQVITVDTGETKDFHGHAAKHFVTTIKGTRPSPYEEAVDGWYLDIPDPGCAPEHLRQRHIHMAGPDFWYNWLLPTGLATQLTSTSPVGLATQVTSTADDPILRKIVEFSEGPVDPSLFEVPRGFKKARE